VKEGARHPGLFIAVEGGEGTGKSSLISGLAQKLEARFPAVVVTREPGGTPGAEAIRALLVQGAVDRWDALTEALLLNAARRDHVERVIRPALEAGAVVICDRYLGSTLVYQGLAKGVPRETLLALHTIATGDLTPDITLLLDAPPEIGLARAQARSLAACADETRFERHNAAFHAQLREGFLDLAAANPESWAVIDATQGLDAVRAAALAALAQRAEALAS
jgi:dTMP kinase